MITFCCSLDNDLHSILPDFGLRCPRYETPGEALDMAPAGSAVLLLADGYPDVGLSLDPSVWAEASARRLRLYVEYPGTLPGLVAGPPRETLWERVVVATDAFGEALPEGTILSVSGCRYVPFAVPDPLMVAARVAGYDTAVFGIPENADPILFRLPGTDALVAATKLSGFRTGRYGPSRAWASVWNAILSWLAPEDDLPALRWTPTVRPAHGAGDSLPRGVEKQALRNAAEWVYSSGLFASPERAGSVREMLLAGQETAPAPSEALAADGGFGILEGYSSAIHHDGSQDQRLPVRADCQAEMAMVLAMAFQVCDHPVCAHTAAGLLRFLYGPSGMQGGARGNPDHPSYGLIAWGAYAPAWEIANYGDDNARVILATMLASAAAGTDGFDAPILRALLANLRTTGRRGFRGDRINMPDLERRGWRSYAEGEIPNPAPHYEAFLWACYLWAWRHTRYRPFYEKAESGIRLTMEAYPDGWRFNDTSERAQMLLPLAWLVRTEDTPEHRAWLQRVALDLAAIQDPCGALPERFLAKDAGYYRIPKSNEDYGGTETPLVQSNGDPASDQLYTTGFALLGLHEAAAATGDPRVRAVEDRLAAYLCRIQTRSERCPNLNGTWFRAFDYRLWDYWSSSADAGWGAWCVEAGWGPAWIPAVLGLRTMGTSLWEYTAASRIGSCMEAIQAEMARNDGGPWRGDPWP